MTGRRPALSEGCQNPRELKKKRAGRCSKVYSCGRRPGEGHVGGKERGPVSAGKLTGVGEGKKQGSKADELGHHSLKRKKSFLEEKGLSRVRGVILLLERSDI